MTPPIATFAVVIPVLNGGEVWRACVDALRDQIPAVEKVLVIDSGSSDGSERIARDAGFDVVCIDKRDFDHGGTRQMAAQLLPDAELIVYLTQDAVLASPQAIQQIVAAFADNAVGVAYGRQLPRTGAGPIEAHARLFNYPGISELKSFPDRRRIGIKAAFTSNSFAAYRTDALAKVGGFPSRLILSEDMVVAARMLMSGWKVAYVADARVYHSHEYSIIQEFRRYFDIGVLHDDQGWLLATFGKPEGEGVRFVVSELGHLWKEAPLFIPSALFRAGSKLAGYKLGQHHRILSIGIKRRMSMHRRFWG